MKPGAGGRTPGREGGRDGRNRDGRVGDSRLDDSFTPEMPGQTRSLSAHGRYTVVRKLTEGGMAEIFLGRQHGSEGFEKPVVLKRIHTAFLADAQFRNMLVDEAHISMGLHHNNIVQVLDLGRAGGRLFLVLELVDGWDLARILDRAQNARFPLPTGLGLYLLAEVCRALSYAHGRTRPDGQAMGIVHRDVSPQNVLVSEQGEVKLTDFGIAKALTKRERTATGVVKGKVAFMSPEQALGQPLDARSDLFSFGTLLYLVSTGVRPFEAATDFEVIARVQKGYFTQPDELRPDMSPALAAVIRRAMTADREQRYQTADELLVDIEGIWRTDFGAPGQTELKLWLAELSRRDGELPIARQGARVSGSFPHVQSDLAEGQALVLGDEGSPDLANRQLDRLAARTARLGSARGGADLGGDVSADVGADHLGRDIGETLGRLDTALDLRQRGTESTFIARPGRRHERHSPVSGVEATSMHDLSLPLDDEGEDGFRPPTRTSGRGFKLGFVLFLAATLGAAALAWTLAGAPGGKPGPAATTAPAAPAGAKPAKSDPPGKARRAAVAPATGSEAGREPSRGEPARPAAAAPARPGRDRAGRPEPAARPPSLPGNSRAAWSPLRRPQPESPAPGAAPNTPPVETEPPLLPPSVILQKDPPPPPEPAEVAEKDDKKDEPKAEAKADEVETDEADKKAGESSQDDPAPAQPEAPAPP